MCLPRMRGWGLASALAVVAVACSDGVLFQNTIGDQAACRM